MSVGAKVLERDSTCVCGCDRAMHINDLWCLRKNDRPGNPGCGCPGLVLNSEGSARVGGNPDASSGIPANHSRADRQTAEVVVHWLREWSDAIQQFGSEARKQADGELVWWMRKGADEIEALAARLVQVEQERDEAQGDLAQFVKMWDDFAKDHVPASTHRSTVEAYERRLVQVEAALEATRAKYQGYIDSGANSDNSVFVGAVKGIDEVFAVLRKGRSDE